MAFPDAPETFSHRFYTRPPAKEFDLRLNQVVQQDTDADINDLQVGVNQMSEGWQFLRQTGDQKDQPGQS